MFDTIMFVLLIFSVIIPIYTYAVYPIILSFFSKKDFKKNDSYTPLVSVIVAAYNEEKVIEKRILNLLELEYPKEKIEFIIASDGSGDDTVNIVNKYSDCITLLDLPRGGKVKALNAAVQCAKGEILVFSDANTMYEKSAIKKLVRHFEDDRIGCVSGQLRYEINSESGEGAKSEGIYWKYENYVKKQESNIGNLSGANGAIYAVLAADFKPIKAGIINDDFYVSTRVLESGKSVIMDDEAIAYEKPNDDVDSQFKRHVRDGAGHYQAICVFWRLLFPRHGAFVHISHRVCKWIVPFLMVVALITNLFLIKYKIMLILMLLQLLMYAMVIVHYVLSKRNITFGFISRLVSIVFYFVSVNVALFCGFIRLISGKQKAVWETQR